MKGAFNEGVQLNEQHVASRPMGTPGFPATNGRVRHVVVVNVGDSREWGPVY